MITPSMQVLNGIAKRDFSAAERKQLAKEGKAMPDGSFPIVSAHDLHSAIHLAGHADDVAAAKRHIITRAKALGLEKEIPSDWVAKANPTPQDFAGMMERNKKRRATLQASPMDVNAISSQIAAANS